MRNFDEDILLILLVFSSITINYANKLEEEEKEPVVPSILLG